MPPAAPEPIRAEHELTSFDSGQPTLDAWLASRAPKRALRAGGAAERHGGVRWGAPGLGASRDRPSKLTSRAELRERNIRCFYFGNPGDSYTIEESDGALLLWSRFPDQRYTDSTAVDETLYDALWDGLELVWQRTVQAAPPDRVSPSLKKLSRKRI